MSFFPNNAQLKIDIRPNTPFSNTHFSSIFSKTQNNYKSVFSPTVPKTFTPFNAFNNPNNIHMNQVVKIYNERFQKTEQIYQEDFTGKLITDSDKEKQKLSPNNHINCDKYLNINTEKINMNINMNVNNNIYQLCVRDPVMDKKIQEEKSKKKFSCNCKKSECLKLYCDCFANGEKCIGCNCRNCSNLIGNEQLIKNAYKDVIDKNPIAMKLNLQKQLKINGCNCSKSNCLKKYCECYKAGLSCTDSCRCSKCNNLGNKEEKVESTSGSKKDKKVGTGGVYDDYCFEKISIFIDRGEIKTKIYKFLKSLNIGEENGKNVIYKRINDEHFIEIPKKMIKLNENEDDEEEEESLEEFVEEEAKEKEMENEQNEGNKNIESNKECEIGGADIIDNLNGKNCFIGNFLGKKIIRPIEIIDEETKE